MASQVRLPRDGRSRGERIESLYLMGWPRWLAAAEVDAQDRANRAARTAT
jgi:hypothetical protein